MGKDAASKKAQGSKYLSGAVILYLFNGHSG